MIETILEEIKKMIGIDPTDTSFDTDLIIHINTVFDILNRLGFKNEPFAINDGTEVWTDYFGDEVTSVTNAVKTYVYLKTKKVFDPPSGAALTAMDDLIEELEWTINVGVDK